MSEKVSTWVSVLEEQAVQRPDSPFLYLVYQDRYISYGETDRNANRLAHYLLKLGAAPGTAWPC